MGERSTRRRVHGKSSMAACIKTGSTGWPICLLLILCLSCPHRVAAGEIPLPAKVVLARAGTLIKKKAYQEAVQALAAFQARGREPGYDAATDPKGCHHPEVYFALGTCHLLLQAYGPAREAFEQAVCRDPGHVSAWLNLAKTCYETSDYARAAQCFGQAYEQAAEKNPERLYYSAAAYLMAGEKSHALAAFENLFARHADAIQAAWRENFVQVLLAVDQPRRALPHIRVLAEAYEGDKRIQWQEILLYQYLQLDMQAKARDYALFLTSQAPDCAKWWKALAHIELQAGRYVRALTAMTVFSFLAELSDQEKTLLADLYLQLGIPAKAAPLYAARLESKNNADTRPMHNLALALQQLGRPGQALAQLDRFAPGTRDPGLLMLQADLLYALERYREAGEAYCMAARAATPSAGRAWLMAGYAALQIDDFIAGRRAFEKAATFDTHRKAALLAIRQLKAKTGAETRAPM